ncbi:CoA-binding protein [Pelagibacteraceae bacterium]|nr:CoA-binding protein [Pelagibacteraceae bacterium]
MFDSKVDDKLIKESLSSAKIIAMVGISSAKKEESSNIIRRPSIIVMSYLQEFGYKVIPINPFSVGKEINGEKVLEKLEDIEGQIDIVNVFRPSAEAIIISKQAVEVGTRVLWLQYGIQNEEAKKIVEEKNITYIANKCIKQEYQRLFLKINPVFPVLKEG